MTIEARKLHIIEEILKIDDEALFAEVEALVNEAYAPKEKAKPSKKCGGTEPF